MFSTLRRLVDEHPLATVLTTAVVLRLLAVVFSKGYMASDDHFQTVHIAYDLLQNGLWHADGCFGLSKSQDMSRFPLYTISLFLQMKVLYGLGIESLDRMMFGIRFTHAMFSLVGVWAVYRIVEQETKSTKWAMIAGLIVAAHFAMPFLAVRNLIEMVGGTIWVVAFYFIYRYRDDKNLNWLILAGIISGLGWMIRFQLLLAMWIVPFMLLFENRRVKPALYHSIGALSMFLIAGLVDWKMTGTFMGSSINHIQFGATGAPTYATNSLIYVGVITAIFIPPFSLFALYLTCRKSFFGQHKILALSTLSFILIHNLLPYRQERYMIPILPVLILMMVLALHRYHSDSGKLLKNKKFLYGVVGSALVINILLLVPFTFNYGHKGEVEPLVRIEQLATTTPTVLFFSPEKARNVPLLYGGFHKIGRDYIYKWQDLDRVLAKDRAGRFDYFLLYPFTRDDLQLYRDSLTSRVGSIEEVFHVEPSLVDYILHVMNPKHNRTNEVWVYKPTGK